MKAYKQEGKSESDNRTRELGKMPRHRLKIGIIWAFSALCSRHAN